MQFKCVSEILKHSTPTRLEQKILHFSPNYLILGFGNMETKIVCPSVNMEQNIGMAFLTKLCHLRVLRSLI